MLLINLIFTELFICLFGIPMDLVATVHGGWWMGEDLCIATGFILTILGIVKKEGTPGPTAINNKFVPNKFGPN